MRERGGLKKSLKKVLTYFSNYDILSITNRKEVNKMAYFKIKKTNGTYDVIQSRPIRHKKELGDDCVEVKVINFIQYWLFKIFN